MKIVLVGNLAWTLFMFRKSLIADLVARGFTVHALAVDYDEGSRARIRSLGAVPVDYTLNRSGVNPLLDIRDTYRLYKIIKGIAPDAAFFYFSKPVILGSIASWLAGVPRRTGMLEGLGFTFTRQPYPEPAKTRLIRTVQVLLYKLSIPLLDRILFLNPDDPVDLIETHHIRAKEVKVVGAIGLDMEEYPYSEPPREGVTFLFVGRLLAEKGIHDFVAAARRVKKTHPHAHFVILGAIDSENPGRITEEELREIVESGIVEYPGHVDDVLGWIRKTGVFVLPSYREGVPRSTQEAMAVGRAVITTDVPGCRETVIDGYNGFLVQPWSPDELAEKMIYFLENPDRVIPMGLNSLEIARRKFDAKSINPRLIEIIAGRATAGS